MSLHESHKSSGAVLAGQETPLSTGTDSSFMSCASFCTSYYYGGFTAIWFSDLSKFKGIHVQCPSRNGEHYFSVPPKYLPPKCRCHRIQHKYIADTVFITFFELRKTNLIIKKKDERKLAQNEQSDWKFKKRFPLTALRLCSTRACFKSELCEDKKYWKSDMSQLGGLCQWFQGARCWLSESHLPPQLRNSKKREILMAGGRSKLPARPDLLVFIGLLLSLRCCRNHTISRRFAVLSTIPRRFKLLSLSNSLLAVHQNAFTCCGAHTRCSDLYIKAVVEQM